MEGLQAVAHGAGIGLFVAAPIGPNATLCIRRTLSSGPAAGLRSGLGVASVHAFYASLAVGGAGGISAWIEDRQSPVRLLGGLFLVALGARLARDRPLTGGTGRRQVSTLLVGLTNPLTLVTFSAVAAAGIAPAGSAPLTVAGVFAGSALWWAILAVAVSVVGRRLSGGGLRWVNRLAAVTLAGFGLAAMASAL